LAGKELWKLELPPASIAGNFGTGVSPIIADGMVILVRDEVKNARIIALDVKDGSPKWEKQRQSPTSYSTPVIWETAGGKQVVVAGHARMVGYDLKAGDEKWSVAGTPSGCVASPVIADGILFFAGYSPSGGDNPEFKLPSFDQLLKTADATNEGFIPRDKAQKTFIKDFFDALDANGDGKITRDEFDAMLKFSAEGKNLAFAVKP